MTFRTTAYPEAKAKGGQQHAVEVEDGRRHVCHRSASPVRMVRLGLSNLSSRTMNSTSAIPCTRWRHWNAHQQRLDAVIRHENPVTERSLQ